MNSFWKSPPLFKDPSDEPQVAKWVHDCPLQHPLDRLWSLHSVLMFLYRTVLGGSGRARAPLHRNRIFHEQFDPHGGKARGRRASRAVLGRLMSQEELRAVN